MRVSRLRLKNWRNFRTVDVALLDRAFIVGPNASGKSNLLDVFKFLRDIAKPGGGLQTAVRDRGGASKIRCLGARQAPEIVIDVELSNESDKPIWRYEIAVKQEVRGRRQPYLLYEKVWNDSKLIIERPEKADGLDSLRLTQTYLEQINSNSQFREIADFFADVTYLHLVPQFLRHPAAYTGPGVPGDPFGRSFLERVAKTPERTRRSRLRKIEAALQIAVPQLKALIDTVDETGVPHLEATYEHWRAHGAKQREDQFSDGTLRLIGLLWSLLDGESLLLLEEPELSLNGEIVQRIPNLMHKIQQKRPRQLLVSTHSGDLLLDPGIAPEEVVCLTPDKDGTNALVAADVPGVVDMVGAGMSVGEAVLPRAAPKQLDLMVNRV
ncbi:MAG: chromosome segregation protein SMC [Deltaproteobacteria bacterium RIFOXYA12_FULL_58_15]|nr:MAG: chromosome segregation protein SMC [Deltaproteobacteria bacterium RIFOXYA12_FULL_58_15]